MPGKNLETKNNLERDEVKDSISELQSEIINQKIGKQIDETFDKFDKDMKITSKPDYNLREQRNPSIEKMKNWKVRLNSYWESCEIDLNSGLISYIKPNDSVLLWEITPELPILDKSRNGNVRDSKINEKMLYQAFWEINVINKAVSMAKKSDKKEFSFGSANLLNSTRELKVDWKNIISKDWLRKWFLNWMIPQRWKNFENEFITMLNRIVK